MSINFTNNHKNVAQLLGRTLDWRINLVFYSRAASCGRSLTSFVVFKHNFSTFSRLPWFCKARSCVPAEPVCVARGTVIPVWGRYYWTVSVDAGSCWIFLTSVTSRSWKVVFCSKKKKKETAHFIAVFWNYSIPATIWGKKNDVYFMKLFISKLKILLKYWVPLW